MVQWRRSTIESRSDDHCEDRTWLALWPAQGEGQGYPHEVDDAAWLDKRASRTPKGTPRQAGRALCKTKEQEKSRTRCATRNAATEQSKRRKSVRTRGKVKRDAAHEEEASDAVARPRRETRHQATPRRPDESRRASDTRATRKKRHGTAALAGNDLPTARTRSGKERHRSRETTNPSPMPPSSHTASADATNKPRTSKEKKRQEEQHDGRYENTTRPSTAPGSNTTRALQARAPSCATSASHRNRNSSSASSPQWTSSTDTASSNLVL